MVRQFFYARVLVQAVRTFLKSLWVLVLAVKVLVEVLKAPLESLWLLQPGDRKSAYRGRESVIRGREIAHKGLSVREIVLVEVVII